MTNEKELTHIDLFSGIGGFTLAAKWAEFKTIAFCEKEEFCQKVLQKRFGAVVADSDGTRTREQGEKIRLQKDKKEIGKERFRNVPESENRIPLTPEIRNFDGTKWRGATLLTGGFPCQPFSVAGQRRGKEDDRYLWPEMLRVISEAKPHWILAENVPGIFRMALDTVLADLEGEGYTVGTFIIPACGLNAPHRRNRVWIVANSSGRKIGGQSRWTLIRIKDKGREDATNRMSPLCPGEEIPFSAEPGQADSHAPDSCNIKGRAEQKIKPGGEARITAGKYRRVSQREWNKNWLEVATRFCRVDDGVSDRIHRLKALGNAIVPQIAYEILKNIAWIEKEL